MRWLRVDDLYSLIPLNGETTTQIAVELWDYVWLITLNRPAKNILVIRPKLEKLKEIIDIHGVIMILVPTWADPKVF